MTTLGTVTVTAEIPLEIDGLFLGYRKRVLKFVSTSEGLVRKGRLYRTWDATALVVAMGGESVRESFALKIDDN